MKPILTVWAADGPTPSSIAHAAARPTAIALVLVMDVLPREQQLITTPARVTIPPCMLAGPGVAEPRSPLRDSVFVILLAAVLVVPPIGQRLIVTSHEARFALIAGDMLERGVWFHAQVRETPYRHKPPLHPWTIAAGAWLRGAVTEGAARLPSALATIATVLGTFLLADRLFHRRAGLWAGLIVATSYGVFAHSQMVVPDMLMIAFGVFAGYGFWRAVTGAGSRRALVAFYALLGLGVFVKGPAGLLPLAVAIAWLTSEHGVSGLRKLWSPPG